MKKILVGVLSIIGLIKIGEKLAPKETEEVKKQAKKLVLYGKKFITK